MGCIKDIFFSRTHTSKGCANGAYYEGPWCILLVNVLLIDLDKAQNYVNWNCGGNVQNATLSNENANEVLQLFGTRILPKWVQG